MAKLQKEIVTREEPADLADLQDGNDHALILHDLDQLQALTGIMALAERLMSNEEQLENLVLAYKLLGDREGLLPDRWAGHAACFVGVLCPVNDGLGRPSWGQVHGAHGPGGTQWALITYSTATEAKRATEAAHKILKLTGAAKPCEVTLARNQGRGSYSEGGSGHGGRWGRSATALPLMAYVHVHGNSWPPPRGSSSCP
ncbi:unnamed protein product [Cladocopium goreaui]|uniref:RRM domain-containing protein n=1 Tax=Cladocopium goreaui TaxID=2562237 RepID=A0A9P1G7D2_9DINO|nr:unnamed protein product [Cladocopium goreaui]